MSEHDRSGDPHELRLLVQPGSEPITGSLGYGAGPPVLFAGWLDLAAAIEALTRAADGDGAPAG